jgi:hypothetical protein
MDALSSVDNSSVPKYFTLAAPQEWLQAWMACYGTEEERLRCAGIKDLANCLLVRILLLECSCRRHQSGLMVCNAASVLTACRVHEYALITNKQPHTNSPLLIP